MEDETLVRLFEELLWLTRHSRPAMLDLTLRYTCFLRPCVQARRTPDTELS